MTGYHLSDNEEHIYVLALREMTNKRAFETLETLQEILKDIDD